MVTDVKNYLENKSLEVNAKMNIFLMKIKHNKMALYNLVLKHRNKNMSHDVNGSKIQRKKVSLICQQILFLCFQDK